MELLCLVRSSVVPHHSFLQLRRMPNDPAAAESDRFVSYQFRRVVRPAAVLGTSVRSFGAHPSHTARWTDAQVRARLRRVRGQLIDCRQLLRLDVSCYHRYTIYISMVVTKVPTQCSIII